MAKAPKVIGVVTEPTPASWWKANRHKVYLAAGLLLGYLLCSHTGGDAHPQQPTPRPQHTAPATPTPGAPSTYTALGLAA